MRREQYLPLTFALLLALVLALRPGPVEARYETGEAHRAVTNVVTVSDWAAVRSGITGADSAVTYSADADVVMSRAQWACFCPRFAGSSDTCTIQPAWYDSGGTFVRLGDAVDFTAGSLQDSGSLYIATEGTEYWESAGNWFCIPLVTAVSGTVTVWGGTR